MHSASSPLLRPHKWFLIVIACGYALAVTATGTDGGKDSATDDASFGDRSALFPNTLRTSDTGPRRVLTNDEESIAAFDETDQLYSYADVSALFAHRRKLAAESNNTLEPIIDALNRRLIGWYLFPSIVFVRFNSDELCPIILPTLGSNCIMVGNGIVPPFFKCTGCVLEQAMGCVDDLRRNLSGSVPYDCLLDVVAEKYSDACCPSYTFLRKQTLLEYSTSAFPQTLACIEAVGCMMSQVKTITISGYY
jgi:hypothetical protein